MRFDGDSLDIIDANNNIVASYGALSGPYGNGPLPEGVWTLSNIIKLENNLYVKDGVGFWGLLYPQFRTERSGIGIHPDGGVRGTRGCIGLTGNASELNDFYNRIHDYIYRSSSCNAHNFINVYVDY